MRGKSVVPVIPAQAIIKTLAMRGIAAFLPVAYQPLRASPPFFAEQWGQQQLQHRSL